MKQHQPNTFISRAAMMLLMMLLTTATAGAWSGSGTTADPYIISSSADWTTFCDALQDNDTYNRFSGKTVKLGADITVTSMAGSSQHDFTGTFDGQGHTLTVNYNTSTNNAAPFQFVETGCLIKNLHVVGTIVTSAKHAAGIIAQQYGTVTIRNCRSSVVIKSSISGDGTHGGLVAAKNSSANLTIENCLFDGKLLTTNSTNKCGGFVGYKSKQGTLTIKNSLYAPAALEQGETEITDNSPTFAREWTPGANDTGLYYTRTLGTEQGTDASGMNSDALAEALGTAWYVSDGKVLPYMGQNYYVYFDTSARKYRSALVPDGVTVVTAINNYNYWGTANEVTWYVIQGDVSGHFIEVKGTANLVLCDDAQLTLDEGLRLKDGNTTLNIYAQSAGSGMGKINATGSSGTAGIGGTSYSNAGTINIYGGDITAQGGEKAAGIGSGYPSSSVTSLTAINIYGGKINATGGTDGAGIGGGGGATQNNITGGPINIYGGQITATAGSYTLEEVKPAGIGKGAGTNHSGYNVFLSWIDADNDFIQSSSYGGGTVTIDADHPFKRSSDGADATTSNIGGQKIVPAQATVYTVTFDTDGGTAVASQGVIKGHTATQPGNPVKQGFRFVKWQLNGADYNFSTAVTADITLTAVYTALPDITYQNASDVTTPLAGADYSPLEPSVTTLNGGTWVVVDDATTFADRITVTGSVTIILTDGKTLTAQRGIGVTQADNAALTIYAQNGGTGTLVAQVGSSDTYDACIGGTYSADHKVCGTIDIYGGRIQTSGNFNGAGIGGGYQGNGGTIRIHGGQIDVSGGEFNHAIGYGNTPGNGTYSATISLGWTRETDYIRTYVNGGSAAQYYGTVTMASNFFLDGTTTKARWTSESNNNIDGQKLIPTQLVLIDWTDVQEGLTAGQTVVLTNDVSSESGQTTLVVPKNVTAAIDLNGYTLQHQNATSSTNYRVIEVRSGATLTISDGSTNGGGTITGNMGGISNYGTTTLSGITISGCGGDNLAAIANNNGGTLSMTDCSVTGNTGGGVENNGTLTLSGKVNITGNTRWITEVSENRPYNVFLAGGTVITLGGALDSDSRIGVYTRGNATITSGAKGKAVLANFTNDNTGFYVCWTTDGTEIQLNEKYMLSQNDGLADLESRYAGQSVRVSFTRTFTDGVASTICLPFAMNTRTYMDNGTFFRFVGVEKGTNEWTVTMQEGLGDYLAAGTPYLFLPKQTGAVTFTPYQTSNEHFTVPASGGFSTVDVTPNTTQYPNAAGWTFKGTFTGEQWAEAPQTPTYGFSAQAVAADGISRGEFVRVGAKVRIRPFRAYMQYVEPASNARGMNRAAADAADLPDVLTVRLIGADDELNGIGTIDMRTGQVTFDPEAWYSMDGVRLPSKPTAKGVYVNNGHKVVIK